MPAAPGSIVKDFDVIEDICPGHSVIPTISTPAHAWLKIIGLAEAPPVIATILATLIRMYEHGILWLAPPDCHQQSIDRQLARQARLHRPSNDLAAAKRLFETLMNYTKILVPGFQLIVTEHANFAEDWLSKNRGWIHRRWYQKIGEAGVRNVLVLILVGRGEETPS
jgi:hypothetical protein